MLESVRAREIVHEQIRNRLHAVTVPLEAMIGAAEWSAFELADGSVVGIIPCQDDLIVTTIGRSQGSMIRLDDQFAHREHAKVRWDSVINAHVLEDNGGLNGTFLDGKRLLYPRRLQDGARIRIGYTELIYRRRWSPSSLTEARTIVATLATPERMTMPLPPDEPDIA